MFPLGILGISLSFALHVHLLHALDLESHVSWVNVYADNLDQCKSDISSVDLASPWGYPGSRAGGVLVALPWDGATKALLCCGFLSPNYLSDAWILHTDATDDNERWERIPSLIVGGYERGYVVLESRRVVALFGGTPSSDAFSNDVYFFDYDLNNWTFSDVTKNGYTPVASRGVPLAPYPTDDGFYATTGRTGTSAYRTGQNMYMFDYSPDTWMDPPDTSLQGTYPGARTNSLIWTDYLRNASDPRFWLFGGFSSSGMGVWNDLWYYRTNFEQWVEFLASTGTGTADFVTFPFIGGRSHSPAIHLRDGLIAIYAGMGYTTSPSAGQVGDLWTFDYFGNIWTPISLTSFDSDLPGTFGAYYDPSQTYIHPGQRSIHHIAYLDGKIWLMGGSRRSASSVPSGWNAVDFGTGYGADLWSLELEFCPIEATWHCSRAGLNLYYCDGGVLNLNNIMQPCSYGCVEGESDCYAQTDTGALCSLPFCNGSQSHLCEEGIISGEVEICPFGCDAPSGQGECFGELDPGSYCEMDRCYGAFLFDCDANSNELEGTSSECVYGCNSVEGRCFTKTEVGAKCSDGSFCEGENMISCDASIVTAMGSCEFGCVAGACLADPNQNSNGGGSIDDMGGLIGGVAGGVVGFVLFVVVLLALVLLIVFLRVKKNKNSSMNRERETETELEGTPTDVTDREYKTASLNINQSLFEINYSDIKTNRKLGSGGSDSIIFLATWQGMQIAFKCFRIQEFMDEQDRFREFEREVEILSSLAHPSILRFYGAALEIPRVGIVMEYCPNGDMQHWCENGHRDVRTCLQLFSEVALGMQFLHSKSIIHRDLKPQNVLITAEPVHAKLCDFGLSRLIEDANEVKTRAIGTSFYMAPELFSPDYTSKVDVFAFAVMLYNVFAQDWHPYGDAHHPEIRVASDPSYRPPIDDHPVAEEARFVVEMMVRGWDHDADVRPTFEEICGIFQKNGL